MFWTPSFCLGRLHSCYRSNLATLVQLQLPKNSCRRQKGGNRGTVWKGLLSSIFDGEFIISEDEDAQDTLKEVDEGENEVKERSR